MTKLTGKVKWFNTQKGFGFITPDDGSDEIFVHQTAIHSDGFRSLREEEPVEFEVEKSDDSRTKAINVTGPDGAHVQGAPRRPSHGSRGGRGGRGGRAKKSAAAKETDDDAKGGTAEAAQETSKGDAPAAPAADAPAA